MKEFKLRFTADVADIEAQFKGAASELKKFAAGVASAENQLEALQQTGSYLTQMDKQLSELKKKYPDIFKQIFGNVDAQMKAALEPLARSSTEVGKLVKEIGDKLSGIASGKVEATNTEMKKLGETVATLAKTMEMQADLDFLNGTDKARLKAQKLIDVLSNLAVAYYKLDKASDQTDLGSLVTKSSEQEKPKKTKGRSKKKTTEASAQPEDSNSALVVEHLKNINNELENQIDELEQQKIRYQEIIDILSGENPDIKLKTTKKTDEQQLKDLVQQFNEATEAVLKFEAANNTSGDAYKKALGEQYRLATLVKNTMDYVSEKGSAKGADYVLSQVGSGGVYDQAEKIIDGLKTSVASSIQKVLQEAIDKINSEASAKLQSDNSSGTEVKAAQEAADAAKLKADENERARLAAEAEAKAAQEAARLKTDGTDIGNTAELIQDVESFVNIEESSKKMVQTLGTEVPQAANTASTAIEDLKSKVEGAKERFFELTKLLDSDLSTGNFDEFSLGKSQAELDKAQQELKELADAGHIATDVMEEVDAAYKKTSSAISTSYEGMRNENMFKEDAGSYDQGYFDAEKRFEQDRISYLHENNELQKKVESLEQKLAQSQTQSTSEIGTDSSSEIVKYEELKQNLNDIITLINAKTDAFMKAGTTIDSVISSEIISLDKLVEKLREVLNNIQNINNTSIDINTENVKNEIDTLFSKLTDSSYGTEYLGLLNSKTGKLSSEYFEGTGNRAEGTFKNKADYDTMFHNHPGVSAAVASFGDWKAFLSEFDNFKRQIILTKDEIKTFDLSGLTKEELKKIVDAIKREIADAKKYDAEWVQDTEKYGKDEATQRWTQRRTESILANYPNVRISTKPVTKNITEPNISNADSEIIQSEINFLSSLENKILDVKRAIEEKNKAFKNEGSTVDIVTTQEIASLDKLLAKINEIKGAIDSKTQSIVNGANTIAANVNDIKTTQPVTNSTKAKTQSISSGIPDIDIERQIALIIKQEAQWKSTGQLTDELHQKIEKLSNDLLNLTNSSDLVVWRKQWMILKDEVTAAKYEIEATKKAQSQSEASSQQYWDSAFKESLSGLITPEKRPELEQLKAYMLQQADQTKEAIAERYDTIMTIITNKNATMQKLMSTKGENERSYWQDQYSAWFGAWEALDEKEIEAFFKDTGNAAVIGSDGIEKFNAQLELSKQLSGKQQDKQLTELNKLYEKQAQSVANQDKYNAQLQSSSVGNAQKDTIREKLKIEQEIEKELQKQIESYGSLYKESDRLTVIEKKRKEAAIEIQENANKEIDRENKRLSNYGKATYTSATKKYENISDVVNNSDFVSDGLLSAMDAYKKKYDELTAARQRFIDNPALAKEESEQNAFRKIAIETDKAREKVSLYIEDIKKYNEVVNSGALKDDTTVEIYNGVKSQTDAIKEYAEKVFEGKLQITGWNAAGNEMYGTLDKGKGVIENVTVALNRGTNELYAYGRGTKEAGTAWKQFTGGIAKKSKEILTYLAGGQSIYQFISEIRKGVQYVKEIDSALTELKKVTDETDQAYAQFLQTMSQTGAEIGATVSDLTNMAANWARLGYSMKEAGNLARSTAVLLNVSEFTDAEKASEALISTIQAYGYAAEDSMHVVDVLNEIGKIIACR